VCAHDTKVHTMVENKQHYTATRITPVIIEISHAWNSHKLVSSASFYRTVVVKCGSINVERSWDADAKVKAFML
jgi:hypothetical protein